MEQKILPKTMHNKAESNQEPPNPLVSEPGIISQGSNTKDSEMIAATQSSQRSENNSDQTTFNPLSSHSDGNITSQNQILSEVSADLAIANEAKINQIRQKIIQAVVSSIDGQDILSNVTRELGVLCQLEACAVISRTPHPANQLQIAWWQEEALTPDDSTLLRSQLERLWLEGDASTAQAMTINAAKSDFTGVVENLVREYLPTKTVLASLTEYQNQVNGAILFFHNQSHHWANSEPELLNSIAETMATAISQTQLQQQNQTKTKYQNLLNNLSREIATNSHPDVLLGTCLAEIGQALQVDRGMILMLKYKDPLRTKRNRQQLVKGKVQIVRQWDTLSESSSENCKATFDLKDSLLCQQAWQLAPEPLAISEQVAFPDLTPKQLPKSIDAKTSALLMMPLMGKKISESQPALVLGFLVLQNHSPRIWLQDELDLINWIGVQMSTAVIHNQTLSQIQSLVDERTAKLKWSLDVHAKLSEKMRQQIEELQKLNELKDDFLSSMSHELKTPLTSMKMAIKMLRQAQIPPAMREKYLNILEQEWNREYNLIKDLLTLQQVESGEFAISLQELNLDRIVEQLAKSFTEKWQHNKGLTLETKLSDSALNLYTDSESIEHILSELLLNAGKYSNVDTVIELSAHSKKTLKNKEIAIAISNYGAGISPEELPHIFDKFRRGKGVTDRAVPGTGLGLALVKYLVDHLNGKIDVTSEPVDGSEVFKTTFTVKLPQFRS